MYGSAVLDEPTPYERDVLPFIRPFTDALVASLPDRPVPRHLDHGAGTGEVVSAVRARTAVALDSNPGMCSRARTRFVEHRDVHVFEGTLDRYVAEPHDQFDLITSQLVLSFVPDPFREL